MIDIDYYEEYSYRDPDPRKNETKGVVRSDEGYWYSISSCEPQYVKERNKEYTPSLGDM